MTPITQADSNRLHLLRSCFSLFVVGIHTTPHDPAGEGTILFVAGVMLDCLYRTAVPGFFLLSGFLLLDKAEYTTEFVKKRLLRVVIPWLFWAYVYFAYRIVQEQQSISFLSTIRCFISGDTYYHLWFMDKLAGVYLALPAIACMVMKPSVRSVAITITAAFLLGPVYRDVGTFLTSMTGRSFAPSVTHPLSEGLLWCTMCGGVIRRLPRNSLLNRIASCVFLLSFASMTFFTLRRSLQAGQLDESIYGTSLTGLMAVSFFFVAMQVFPGHRLNRCVKATSDCSFGIYLAHPLVIGLSPSLATSIPGLNTILFYSLTFVCVYTLRKIPGIKYVT